MTFECSGSLPQRVIATGVSVKVGLVASYAGFHLEKIEASAQYPFEDAK
jgi:hypothetical protein